MKRYFVAFFCVGLCLVSHDSATAQSYLYQTGVPTFSAQIPIENGFINLNNGAIHIEIPLAAHPQRGSLQLNERLVYDSRIWQIIGSSSKQWQPTNVPNSMGGWRFVSGGDEAGLAWTSTNMTQGCAGLQGAYQPYTVYSNFSWTDPQGTTHRFMPSTFRYTNGPSANCIPPTSVPTASGWATDGSGYFVKITNFTTGIIYDQQGNIIYAGSSSAGANSIVDRNGNYWTHDTSGNLVDSVGRTPVKSRTNGNLIYYDVLGENGQTQTYTITTQPVSYNTEFGQVSVTDVQGSFTTIQSITLPDGTAYSFTYDSGSGSGNYGELESVTLPTGGTISYGYTTFLDAFQNKNRWVSSRVKDGYSTTFAPAVVSACSVSSGCQETVTVTSPSDNASPTGNQTVYTFTLDSGGYINASSWNTGVSVYQGLVASGNVLSSSSTNYVYQNEYSYQLATSYTTTTNVQGSTSQTVTALDQVGNPTSIKKWDYYSGSAPSSPTVETDYSYGYTVNQAEFLTQVTTKGSSNNQVAQTIYGYDEATGSGHAAVAPVSNLPQNPLAPGGNRGNVTTTSRWLSTTGSNISTMATYDAAGSTLSSTDSNGTTYYGYDGTDSLVTSITRPNTGNVQHITTVAYDPSTGLIVTSSDENNNKTNFFYEPLRSRISQIKYPDGGQITYSYPSTTEVDSATIANPNPSISQQTIGDSYGRISKQVSAGVSSETSYDTNGRISCVTNPHFSTSSPTDGSTCVSKYDALGRPLVQTEPGGNTLTWSYSGNTVNSNDEAGHQWQRSYDAFGRLSKVTEPIGASTAYVYDALNNLNTVTQNGVSGETPRIRNFIYDSLSRLTSSSNPETGAVNYSYDANGNLRNKTDARGISINYQYDTLNRLIQKTASDGSLNYSYLYDLSGHGAGIGRLGFASNNVNAAYSLNYDPMGRITQKSYCIPTNCSYSTVVNAAYDLAGNQISLTYPDGRTISQASDSAGHLASITYTGWNGNGHTTSYLSPNASPEYDPANHLINATMGNGVGIAASYDNRERLNLLAYGTSNQLLWGKTYAWTPNSNLQTITDASSGVQRWLVYDNLNRLSSAQDLIGSQQGANTSPYPSIPGGWTGSNSGTVAAVPFWTDPDESNLLDNADAPGASGWGVANASLTSGITAPDGTTSAYTFTASSGSSDTYLAADVDSQSLFDGESMVGSVWLRSPSGSQTVNLYLVESGSAGYSIQGYKPVTVTQNWQQFQLTGQFQYGHQGLIFQIGGGATITSGQAISIWGTKLEDAGTTGPTITNFLPYSQRFTASTWSGNSTVSDNSAVAPDGTNTAATATAGTGDSWIVDSVRNPSPYTGQMVTASVWMRSPSGPQNISMTLLVDGNVPVGTTVMSLSTNWQRLQVSTNQASTLNELALQLGGGGSFQNGQSFQVWGAQMELASTAGPYVATGSTSDSTGMNLTNILPYSQQPNAPSWGGTYGGSGVMNAVVAPDSSITGYQFTFAGGGGWLTNDVTNPALYNSAMLTGSVFLRSPNGAESIDIYLVGQNASGRVLFKEITAQLTSTWQRFSLTGQAPNGLTRLFLQIGDNASTGVIDVWGSQMELSSSAGPYVVTSQLPVVAGKELSNILSSSQQVSGPGWGIANGSITATTGGAPDGTNTAATVTATAGSPDTYVINNAANPSLYDGQTITASVYLKVPSGSLNTYLFLVNSGVSGFAAPYVGVSVTTSWQRFTITTQVQNGLAQLALQIGGATTFTSGSIQIWGSQMVLGSAAAPYMETTSTTSNPVTGQAATPVSNGLNQSYVYDSFGNLKQNGSFNDVSTAQNQLFGYAYDAAGNLLSDGLTTMSWDGESKLISAGGATYIYDPDGNRVEKQGFGVTDTIYFGGRPIARLSAGAWTDLIYGPNRLLAEVAGTETAQPNYRLLDHLGTQVGTVGSNGIMTNPMDYTPFGQVFEGSNNDPYMFTGKERDAESGLDYFGSRYMSSTMGRFMSPDPINLTEARLLNPANTLNKYIYGGNNPLKYVDPDGKDITIFYESPSLLSLSAGHIFFTAENQQTGDAAVMSFGPIRNGFADDETTLAGLSITGTTSFGLQNMTADDLRQTYSSLTIQTSPEEAQQIIDFIQEHPGVGESYMLYNSNCTTVCVEALKIIGKLTQNNKDWTPAGLWKSVFANYANPYWQNGFGWTGNNPGTNYGQPRGGYDPYQLVEILSQQDNTSVTTTQGDGTACGGDTGYPCQ